MRTLALIPLLALLGCTFVGNSPEERKHREQIKVEEDSFNRQKYERRYHPAVEETEVFFSFTNRMGQRAKEPMALDAIGKLFVNEYGSNVAWQVVSTAYTDNVPDTAWFIQHRDQWMP